MSSKNIKSKIEKICQKSKLASHELSKITNNQKNNILMAMSKGILKDEEEILVANSKDVENAMNNGLSKPTIDRLKLTKETIRQMAEGIEEISKLPNPNGEIIKKWSPKNKINIKKKRVPIGTIGIIYESRPNVTSDAASLCLKTGNATILKGGREAFLSNVAIEKSLIISGEKEGLPEGAISLIPFISRESVNYLCKMDKYIDLIIPRGGKGLIETVVDEARMPVIKHFDGICHVYVDKKFDQKMAEKIIINSKCQKPSVCNATESLLIHKDIAKDFIPIIANKLLKEKVEIRADENFRKIFKSEKIKPASQEDWSNEYLDYILSIKVINNIDEAISHINTYGSHHTDVIVTNDENQADKFQLEVDSSCVFWNISSRFSDGYEFGFGAEIGISTDKIHARGPMALEELCSYKYIASGTGQIK